MAKARNLRGARELERRLARLRTGSVVERAAAQLLNEASEKIMTAARRETPVDKGVLRASAFVEPPDIRRNRIRSRMGFGGAAAPYAVIVHESLTARHPVGKAKYLEDPFKTLAPQLIRTAGLRIGKRIARFVTVRGTR